MRLQVSHLFGSVGWRLLWPDHRQRQRDCDPDGDLDEPMQRDRVSGMNCHPCDRKGPRKGWRRRPDLNRGWRFCRFRRVVDFVDWPCSLVPDDGRSSLVFGRYLSRICLGPFGTTASCSAAARTTCTALSLPPTPTNKALAERDPAGHIHVWFSSYLAPPPIGLAFSQTYSINSVSGCSL